MRCVKTVAIDGPAGSGKSTIGAMLARHLGYVFVDAGILYRAITGAVLAQDIDIYDQEAVVKLAQHLEIEVGHNEILMNGNSIPFALHSDAINQAVPIVAAYSEVRMGVRQIQQKIAQHEGIVFSGRDIGTVVLPHAELKIYLNPSLEERASRRHAADSTSTREQILEALRKRDWLDSVRTDSPLRIAEDAVVVNTDGMEIQEVLGLLLTHICYSEA